jgi:pimeloyl-ACP methyl ester carboxylesterase
VTAPSSDGVEVALHHLVAAAGGPRLLIAHATGFHGRAYAAVASALGGRFDVWALDHRGHGATAAPDGWVVDWSGFADDAAAAADAIGERPGGGPLYGFGHSLGGATLLTAARQAPDRFAGLVLFEPIVFPPEAYAAMLESGLVARARRRRQQFASYAEAVANFASKPPMRSFHPAALADYVAGGFRPAGADDPDGPVTLCCTPEFEAETFLAGWRQDLWPYLPEIHTPALVVAGADDVDGPSALAVGVASRLPHATYAPHPELDHMGPFTHPAAVADIVRDAVARWRHS